MRACAPSCADEPEVSRSEWIPLAARDRWEAALQGIPHGFAHRPEYSAAVASVGGHAAGLWAWQDDRGRAACPLLRRASPGGGFDIATPLGFAGFACAGDTTGLEAAWSGHWREAGALCAYVQLSPWREAADWRIGLPGLAGQLSPSRECWLWDLRPAPDALAAAMAPKHRQLLHKWQRESARLCWDAARLRPAFDRLYADFLARRDIGAAYRFTPAAMAELSEAPGVLWVGALDAQGEVEAVTVFLWHGEFADSFLNAATPAGRAHSRGLYWQGALRLRELGVRWLNLGGGLRDGDELARFKQRLGASPRRTLVLRQVFDAAGFERACATAGVAAGVTANAGERFPPWA